MNGEMVNIGSVWMSAGGCVHTSLTGPQWNQNEHIWVQFGPPVCPQLRPQKATNVHKRAQKGANAPKMGPKWEQHGPKVAETAESSAEC
jgi:hypothetical protein